MTPRADQIRGQDERIAALQPLTPNETAELERAVASGRDERGYLLAIAESRDRRAEAERRYREREASEDEAAIESHWRGAFAAAPTQDAHYGPEVGTRGRRVWPEPVRVDE